MLVASRGFQTGAHIILSVTGLFICLERIPFSELSQWELSGLKIWTDTSSKEASVNIFSLDESRWEDFLRCILSLFDVISHYHKITINLHGMFHCIYAYLYIYVMYIFQLFFQKVDPNGCPTLSAHPARFSPDDKFSKQRVMLKKRFGLLPTQQPKEVCWKNRQQLVDRNHAVFSKIEKHIIVWIQSLLTVFSSFILSCSITFFCLPCFLVHIIIRMSNKILEK